MTVEHVLNLLGLIVAGVIIADLAKHPTIVQVLGNSFNSALKEAAG
jgi:hypothetical protein